ncbi:CAF1-domain-containing protein [Dothidotthia symphoricarpi CBS 119687]|uniref:CAF1-domain-containing protein n=1 Tax=Dothidotthia symphoricarpi CBS 119687 TaxID=1392245 RepID=A0A6A6A6D4_9PLEO|nr:CAF1-domain-containing protein [Dothidotthia symphoricarpi CBS 119687]KAF2126181.1 CAF1-domain-containing protein [Dothidotthia symphoricarpi CBS 119687]
MEVDAVSFPYHLLGLFIHISEADFVSFDLELSGIPSRLPNKPPRTGSGRLTLEERYAETKAGADRYSILQVGITCARFDYIANQYVLRPYNINISPLLDERLDFEREISFQSGACTFLLNNGFDLGAPFAKGVQYLSREEAERAKQLAWDRLDKKNPIEDLQLKSEDVESLDFMRRAREAIAKWKATASSSLEITTHTGLSEKPSVAVISRFEKRLVHQLVRAEFPEFVSIGRADCVRIIEHDPVREADNTKRIKNRVKEQINRQTGFRWVFEALVQGEIADPLFLPRGVMGDNQEVKDRWDRAVERLKTKQPVLVGHNMFTDIVYFYRTFVGPLPDTLDEFCDATHKLFPNIVDTKYLATYAEGDLNASPTLQEIAKGLNGQMLPTIITHADHSKYQEAEAFHEAGYDSLLTATIMLKLAAKLGAERKEKEASAQTNGSSNKDNSKTTGTTLENTQDLVGNDYATSKQPAPVQPSQKPDTKAKGKRKQRNKGKRNSSKPANGRFNTKNVFETLRELRLGTESDSSSDDVEKASVDNTWGGEQHGGAAGSWEDEAFVQDKSGWVPIEQMERQAMELIPGVDSAFWHEFGNKLRVFGTQEAVLAVADWPAKRGSSMGV